MTGGTSATGSGTGKGVGSQTAPQVQQNQAPQNNNGYTDVSSYLNANQQGGAQLGNQVASNLTQGYNTTKQGIDTSAANANQQVSSGYIPENTQLIQQVASDPTTAAANSGLTSGYQAQLNDTYSGPANWADLGTQQGNVNTAVQNANLLNTPGGNNVLINQVENQQNPGQTSQGVNALDTLLFSGNPNAVGTAKTAAQPYNTLNDYLNAQNTAIGTNITGAQNNAAQTSQDALNAFTGANGTLTNLNTNINNTAATDLSQAQQQQAALKADIGNLYGGVAQNNATSTIQGYGGSQSPWYNTQNYSVGQLSPQDLQSLGITQDQWNALQSSLQGAATSTASAGNNPGSHNFGAQSPTAQIALQQYLTQNDPTTMINAGNTATAPQYQEMAAINQLLGTQAPTQTEAINPLNAASAGTYNPANLNQFDYSTALNTSNQVGSAEQKAALDEANALNSGADLAHAQGMHGGIFNSLKNAVTHPGNLLGTLSNPLGWAQNATNVIQGKNIDPYATSVPGAKVIAPLAGAVVGGIYGGPTGAMGGASAGQAVGGTLQNSPDLWKGGDISDYLDKKDK